MIRAVFAVFHRPAQPPHLHDLCDWPWRDSGIRGDSEDEVLAAWRARPATEREWQEVEVRLVPAPPPPLKLVPEADLDACRHKVAILLGVLSRVGRSATVADAHRISKRGYDEILDGSALVARRAPESWEGDVLPRERRWTAHIPGVEVDRPGTEDLVPAIASDQDPNERSVATPGTPSQRSRCDVLIRDIAARCGISAPGWAAEFHRLHGGDQPLLIEWFAAAIHAGLAHVPAPEGDAQETAGGRAGGRADKLVPAIHSDPAPEEAPSEPAPPRKLLTVAAQARLRRAVARRSERAEEPADDIIAARAAQGMVVMATAGHVISFLCQDPMGEERVGWLCSCKQASRWFEGEDARACAERDAAEHMGWGAPRCLLTQRPAGACEFRKRVLAVMELGADSTDDEIVHAVSSRLHNAMELQRMIARRMGLDPTAVTSAAVEAQLDRVAPEYIEWLESRSTLATDLGVAVAVALNIPVGTPAEDRPRLVREATERGQAAALRDPDLVVLYHAEARAYAAFRAASLAFEDSHKAFQQSQREHLEAVQQLGRAAAAGLRDDQGEAAAHPRETR